MTVGLRVSAPVHWMFNVTIRSIWQFDLSVWYSDSYALIDPKGDRQCLGCMYDTAYYVDNMLRPGNASSRSLQLIAVIKTGDESNPDTISFSRS
jgi:hypothetical protein